jgi:CO/xanthine dehydrogenase FAD-binding subunit
MLRIQRALIANTPEEAYELLSSTEGRGMYIAGGTTIAQTSGKGLDFLVDLNRLGLDSIRKTNGRTEIGAAARIEDISVSPLLMKGTERILCEAGRHCATPQVRNLATIGGSIMVSGYPTDLAPALLALGAGFEILGKETKEVPAFEFFSGGSDVYHHGDLITKIFAPPPEEDLLNGVSFEKLGRTAIDVAIVNVAAVLHFENSGRIVRARLACGGLGGPPMRLIDVEDMLAGEKLTEELLVGCAEISSKSAIPKTDVMASSEYRSVVLGVLVRRAIENSEKSAGLRG